MPYKKQEFALDYLASGNHGILSTSELFLARAARTFFVDNVKNKYDSLGTAVAGYMPRGYNAGFIYDGGSERTISHELAYGDFTLKHTFEQGEEFLDYQGKTACGWGNPELFANPPLNVTDAVIVRVEPNGAETIEAITKENPTKQGIIEFVIVK